MQLLSIIITILQLFLFFYTYVKKRETSNKKLFVLNTLECVCAKIYYLCYKRGLKYYLFNVFTHALVRILFIYKQASSN